MVDETDKSLPGPTQINKHQVGRVVVMRVMEKPEQGEGNEE